MHVPYTAKRFRGKFLWFLGFFIQLRMFSHEFKALSIASVSLQACYRESFPANGNFVP